MTSFSESPSFEHCLRDDRPFEALVNAAVGDLYFVHVRMRGTLTLTNTNTNDQQERGKRMALTNLAVFGGAFFTPIVVGKITDTIGWSWTFYLVAIFTGACLPLVIFFVPETAYQRSEHLNTDLIASDAGHNHSFPKSDNGHQLQSLNEEIRTSEQVPLDQEAAQKHTVDVNSTIPKKSFTQSLLPFNGRVSDDSFWKLLLRPFPLFAHPAILWACLIQGSMIGWTVFIGIILAVSRLYYFVLQMSHKTPNCRQS